MTLRTSRRGSARSDRRLYDGGDGGVVLRAGFRAEASADLEFGLGRPQGLLAVVVRGRNNWERR